MKTKAFLVAMVGILFAYAPVMAGNFYVGKIPESGSGEALFLQSDKVWIGNVTESGKKEGDILVNKRNADPCGLLSKWGLVLDEWKDGGHGLSPAKIFVLSVEENDGNVVTMLAKAKISQKLNADGSKWNVDFEYQLLESMSYGANQSDRCRWYGDAPNKIGESYQNALEESRGLTFEQAFAKSTDNQGDWWEFQNAYANLARFMNRQLDLNTSYSPNPTSSGYYHDFAVTPLNRDKYISAVQLLFELTGSPLADEDLFKKSGSPSIINYDTPTFCQCQ